MKPTLPNGPTAARRPDHASRLRGFVLIAALWLLVLMGLLGTLCYWTTLGIWRMERRVEGQLEARLWAENGIEYASSLLSTIDLNATLGGPDGIPCPGTRRNPASFQDAVQLAPGDWEASCDDGFPVTEGGASAGKAIHGARGRMAAIRFSNNSEEDPRRDQDRVVLVRSLGVAPRLTAAPETPEVRNSAFLIEARLRQERALEPSGAINILADEASLSWSGRAFSVDGADHAAIAAATWTGDSLPADLADSVAVSQIGSFQADQGLPLFMDFRLDLLSSPDRQRILSPGFWSHFRLRLPDFDRGLQGGLAFLSEPGDFSASFQGFLAVAGELRLKGDALVRGLLVHLGPGRVEMTDRARVEGAIWLTNAEEPQPGLHAEPVSFAMGDQAAVRFDAAAVREALSQLPATRLGWRILFPEMSDGGL